MIRLSLAALLAALAAAELAAQPYCSVDQDGFKSCGIATLQDCENAMRGVGGSCIVDDSADIPPPIEGPIQKWIEREEADSRPRSPDLDQVPPPPFK